MSSFNKTVSSGGIAWSNFRSISLLKSAAHAISSQKAKDISRCYFASKKKNRKQMMEQSIQKVQYIENDQNIIDIEEEDQEVDFNLIEGISEQSFIYDQGSIKGRLQKLIPSLQGFKISDMYSRDGIDFEQNIEDTVNFLKEEFALNQEELSYLFQRNHSAFFQLKKDGSHPGIYLIKKYFIEEKQLSLEKVKQLILRGSRIFALDRIILNGQFEFFQKKFYYSDEEILETFIKVPELLYKSGDWHYNQIFEYFQLYMKWNIQQIVDLIKLNPWILALNLKNFILHMKQLKSYKFNRRNIYELVRIHNLAKQLQLMKDASILAQKPSVIRQLFSLVRDKLRIKSNDLLKSYALKYPEILLQGKFRALEKKIQLLQNNGCSKYLIRKIFRAHPQLFLKSLKSFEVKIQYLTKNIGVDLKENDYFPLCLMFDFRQVIYPRQGNLSYKSTPRLQLLSQRGQYKQNEIDLSVVLATSDEQFCEQFEISLHQLRAYRSIEYKEEKDILWRYVTKI